jgi:hypothetical protein
LAKRRPRRRDKRSFSDPRKLGSQGLLSGFLVADEGEAVLLSFPVGTLGPGYKRGPNIAAVLDAALSQPRVSQSAILH